MKLKELNICNFVMIEGRERETMTGPCPKMPQCASSQAHRKISKKISSTWDTINLKDLQFFNGWGMGERDCDGTIYPKMSQCASSQAHRKISKKISSTWDRINLKQFKITEIDFYLQVSDKTVLTILLCYQQLVISLSKLMKNSHEYSTGTTKNWEYTFRSWCLIFSNDLSRRKPLVSLVF